MNIKRFKRNMILKSFLKHKKLVKTLLVNTFHIVIILFVLHSCKMPDKWFGSEAGKSGLAHFDYFKYKGADDFYRENPLPGDDYFYNPVLPGWNSDPSICKKGGDYFLVTSTFSYFPGVPIFHSTDLVNWKQIGFVLDRTSQLKLDGQSTSQGIFAPAISYNPYNETFYMITTNIGGGNFFVKTKDPFGSWSEPVWLPEVHGIDPSFFFDDDGKAYIVNNDEPAGPAKYDGHRAIRIREFDVVNEKVVSPEKILLDGGVRPEENPIWIEGPHMYKINGTYFLMAAEGGTSTMHSEVILKGNSPMGRFIPWENNPILTQRHLDPNRENPVTCAGHADLVQDEKGEWWSVFLACRPIGNNFENLGRETFLLPVRWSEDNFPYMTQADELIPMIVRKEGIKPASGCLNGNFECVDDFDSSKLGFEWFTLRTPATDLFSLVQKTGYLSLNCSDIHASERKTPAFVARRIQHHKFECETMLNLASQNQTDAAGMLIYKDETHQYFLSVNRSEKNYRVSLKKISEFGTEVIADKEIKEKKFIRLKVISTGEEFEFYFAGKKSDWELLADKIDAFYLSTANSFGFTGSTIGMYATQN